MWLLVIRRTGLFLASLLVASIIVFIALALLPGDAAQTVLGVEATPEALERLRVRFGLDRPLIVQYVDWLAGVVRGDFGVSYVSRVPIAPLIGNRLLVTVPLVLLAMTLALVGALPLGTFAAARHGRWESTAVSAAAQVGIAIPAFWAGIMLIALVSVRLGWLPAGGFTAWGRDAASAARSLLLPAVSIALVQGAILTRYTRSAVVDVLREDFIRTARAVGNTPGRALWRHGLRNAAIPVITVLGLQLSYLLAGAVVIENVFFLPGLGRMLVQAIGQRDLLLVQGTVVVLTAMVLLVNFATDLAYYVLDPRLRPS
ncbi:MAG TPA: ABC transporter permease [Nitriliruptorales bacterium]